MEKDKYDKTPDQKSKFSLLFNKIKNVPLQIIRLTLKASIAINITLILVFATKSRLLIGSAAALAAIATLIYLPVRPVGVQIKIIIQGLLSAGVGSAWCYLGNFLANLARDPAIESPLQPASSAVSAVFCVVLMAVLGYVRAKYPQADFLTIFASMIAAFALTQNAATPGFQPTLTLTFFSPILFSSAVSLAVTILLWPEDSVTGYLDAVTDVLDEYNNFFMENTTAFLGSRNINQHHEPYNISLPALRTRLQSKFVKLVDLQHDMNFAVTYHQFSHKDISQMTQDVKSMRTPLHGIGVSNLCKHEALHGGSNEKESDRKVICIERDKYKDKLIMELIDACNLLLKECNDHISRNYKVPPRTVWTTFLWPFPRVFYKTSSTSTLPVTLDAFDDTVERFKAATATINDRFQQPEISVSGLHTEQGQLNHLFDFNLVGYADRLRNFASFVDQLNHLQHKKFSFPSASLKSWLKPSASNKATFMGGQFASGSSIASGDTQINNNSSGRSDIESDSLKPSGQQDEEANLDEDDTLCAINRKDRTCPRDPDVDAPRTTSEHFFNYCSMAFNWFYSMPTLFALKTAAGFILLSLPAYFPSSVGWFTGWGGQWVANVFIMWIFPISGMFNFTIGLGLIGSIIGTVISIVAWEIVRGNAYGLSVMSFVVMIASNFMFFMNQNLSFMSIMIQYTYMMIITINYQEAVDSALTHDTIEMGAGKRMIFVVLGILGASLINWFPRPVTGRVELRKMVSNTIRDINMLYGVLFADVFSTHAIPLDKVKAFKKLALGIQRQLKVEETYLNFTKLEPPLKGKFPFETYRELLERLNNMADLAEGMAYSARNMDKSWSRSLIKVFHEEKFDYVFCSINIMCTLSATLMARIPLPPYMISHEELKRKIDEKLCLAMKAHPEQSQNKTFPNFNAFSVACSRFTNELCAASRCVERLLGVDLPEKWLQINLKKNNNDHMDISQSPSK